MELFFGDMAQLVERLVRNEEASGSNPLSSTKRNLNRIPVKVGDLGSFFFMLTTKIIFKGVSFSQGNAFHFVLNKYLPLWNRDKNSGLCRERLLTREWNVVGYLPRQEKSPLGLWCLAVLPYNHVPKRLLSRVPWNK